MVLLGDETQVEAHFVCFEILLILTQYRCIVWAKHTIGSEIIQDTPMELLRDLGLVESHFCPYGCKIGAWFVPKALKPFWMHPMVFLCDETQLEACFGLFRDSANLDARSMHGFR
jgi:hypothetical protein